MAELPINKKVPDSGTRVGGLMNKKKIIAIIVFLLVIAASGGVALIFFPLGKFEVIVRNFSLVAFLAVIAFSFGLIKGR